MPYIVVALAMDKNKVEYWVNIIPRFIYATPPMLAENV